MTASRFKFRAWDHSTSAWVNGWQRDFNDLVKETPSWEGYVGVSSHYFDIVCSGNRVTVMQSTGLTDKNGKEIFEGDVVECSMSFDGSTLPHRGEVVYDNTFAGFATKNLGGVTLLHHHCLHTMQVIGNIYENPELMEANNDGN